MNFSIKPISDYVKGVINRRKKAQENFRNRKDNSNYYGSWKDFE